MKSFLKKRMKEILKEIDELNEKYNESIDELEKVYISNEILRLTKIHNDYVRQI